MERYKGWREEKGEIGRGERGGKRGEEEGKRELDGERGQERT